MIIDSAVTYDLTIGQSGRRPTPDDAQVVVPPIISPVALTLMPHLDNVADTVELNASAFYHTQVSRTNQAAIQQIIATLAPGLYELELSLSTFSSFSTAVGAFVGTAILLTFGTFQKAVLKRLAAGGSFTDYNRLRVLLRQDATLALEIGVTGVGQSLDGSAHVNVIRIL